MPSTPDETRDRPYVRRFLDLSTSHLPENVSEHLDTYAGVRAYETEYGWFVYAPDSPDDHARREDQVPKELVPVWRFARAHGCAYVLFDRDADPIDGLPLWDW